MYILLVEKKLIFFFIDKSIIFYTIDNKMDKKPIFVIVTTLGGDSFRVPVLNGDILETAREFKKLNSNNTPPRSFTLVESSNNRITIIEVVRTIGDCRFGINCYNKNCQDNHPEGRVLVQNQEVRQARLDKSNINCKYGTRCTRGELCPFAHDSNHGAAVGGAARGRSVASGGAAVATDAK